MIAALRSRLTYANVAATIALVLSLGAGAYAAGVGRNSIGASQIVKNAVGSSEIEKGAVGSSEIHNKSILLKELNFGKEGGLSPLPGWCPEGSSPQPTSGPFGITVYTCQPDFPDFSGGLQPCPPDAGPGDWCLPVPQGQAGSGSGGPPGIPSCPADAKPNDLCFNPDVPVAHGQPVRGVIGWMGPSDYEETHTAYASFPFFAGDPLDAAHVLVDDYDDPSDLCHGTAASPTAPSGYVCVYLRSIEHVGSVVGGVPGDPAGDIALGFKIEITIEPPDGGLPPSVGAEGTWAYEEP